MATAAYFVVSNSNKQTALQEEQAKQDLAAKSNPQQQSVQSNAGKAAILKASAQDAENNDPTTQVAVPALFYTKDAEGKFSGWIGQGATTLLSATAATSVTPVTIGQTVYGIAFNGTGTLNGFYGEEKAHTVTTEGDSEVYVVHTICRADQLQGLIYDNRQNTHVNLTVGASSTNSFKQAELHVNGTDCAYKLGGFYVDLIGSTHINNVDIGSALGYTGEKNEFAISKTNKNIQRVSAKDDYVFELGTPLMLHENQYFLTGGISLSTDGTGCSSAEGVNITAFDKANFKSAKAGVGIAFNGIETDATSPVDVGAADKLFVSEGKGASVANTINGDGSTSFWCTP